MIGKAGLAEEGRVVRRVTRDCDPGEARSALARPGPPGRGARGADFAWGRWAWGAVQRLPAPLPTIGDPGPKAEGLPGPRPKGSGRACGSRTRPGKSRLCSGASGCVCAAPRAPLGDACRVYALAC